MLASVFGGFNAGADDTPVSFSFSLEGSALTLDFGLVPDLRYYYILDSGPTLAGFTPQKAVYGGGPHIWHFSIATTVGPAMFWRVRQVPVTAPLDLDGDGIDDLFELTHGLNLLDPADASSPSGLADASGQPLNWLAAYHYYFTDHIQIFNQVSREISNFNFGQPAAKHEALSREISSFNTPLPDNNHNGLDDQYEFDHGLTAASASQPSGFTTDFPDNTGQSLTWLELYRLNFGVNARLYETIGREVSIFNFGQSTADLESVSRALSVFNVPSPDANGDGIDDAYAHNHGLGADSANQFSGFTDDLPNNAGVPLTWLQLYRGTFGQNRTLYDFVSRETSVFNFGQATAHYEGISREVSLFNFGQPAAPTEGLSREVSVFNEP